MALDAFKANLEQFRKSLNYVPSENSSFIDFKNTQANYYKNMAKQNMKRMKEEVAMLLQKPENLNNANKAMIILREIEEIYESPYPRDDRIRRINRNIESLAEVISKLDIRDDAQDFERNFLKLPVMPKEIESEIVSDTKEMKRCFDSGCYKASTIMCGRILETSLHRLYYDKTKIDLLETSPGIGLGKIIAKLFESGIDLGPGVNEQIHLINNVRISSVHVKKNVFSPSKEQSQAIILFTIDVINRIFGKSDV